MPAGAAVRHGAKPIKEPERGRWWLIGCELGRWSILLGYEWYAQIREAVLFGLLE